MDCLNEHPAASPDIRLPAEYPTTSLAALMARLSDELGTLAQASERMHDLLGDGAGRSDAAFVMGAQSIDHSHQHLAALSAFLACLSQEIEGSVQVDLARPLACLTLSDLRHRLSPGSATVAAHCDSGEMEFL